eukprot:10513508-Prorocentrum_lima.AAC.1
MTSSLVGSEMCIRDRPRYLVLGFLQPTTTLTLGPDRSSRDDSCDPFPPVSYTHLTLPTICSV